MSKLSKIAKNMDIFANVMFWIFAVASVCCISLPCGLAIIDESAFSNVSTSLTLGNIEIELAKSIELATIAKNRIIFGLCLVSVALGIFCYIIYYVRKILAPMKEGKPFTSEVTNSLKKLAFISLIGGGVFELFKLMFSLVIFDSYSLATLLSNENIANISFRHTINGSFILLFAIFYLLHFVFKYGEELQKESDETL